MDDFAEGSVTHWLVVLKRGDRQAATPLFDRYYRRIVALARAKLGGKGGLIADEEDAAVSVLVGLLDGAPEGKFPLLDDRDDLWSLLAVMTVRKVADLKKHQSRLKRGGARLVRESDLAEDASDSALENVPGADPTPEFIVMMAEECERRLNELNDDFLRNVAMLRLDGFSNREIAERMGYACQTIKRKVKMIKMAWGRREDETEAA